VNLTQEEVSHMLGVRRSGVTVAAGVLRGEGLIEYRRGSMTVVDAAGWKCAPANAIAPLENQFVLW
jgi:DNA-binding FadR family transcriptional regulator